MRRSPVLLWLVVVVGCAGDASMIDVALGVDARTAADSGSRIDVPMPGDGARTADLASARDGTPHDDGRTNAVPDAGLGDGSPADGSAPADGATANDAASATDGGPSSTIAFSSGFSGVQICDEDGECAQSPLADSYYECADIAVHLTGTDSETGDRWPSRGVSDGDLPGDGRTSYFNDVIKSVAPDCCPSNCHASTLGQCHRLELISTTQHDGTTGEVLVLQPLKDCSDHSYSRLQYNIYDADPPTGDDLEDLSAFYYEVWMRLPDLDTAMAARGQWASLCELYMSSGWKLSIVLSTSSGKPMLYTKNGDKSQGYKDNDLVPEQSTWFKIRAWYKAGQTDGHWKVTYTCPDCTPAVPETVIKEWRGRTQEVAEDPYVAALLKNAGTYGLELQLDDFKLGPYPTQ